MIGGRRRRGLPALARRGVLVTALLAASCRPAGPPATSPAPPLGKEMTVRVGIAVEVDAAQVSSTAPFQVVVVSSGETVRAAAREVWTFRADAAGRVEGRGPGGKVIGPASGLIRVDVQGGREPVLIDGKPYRGGALLRAAGGGKVTAINIVDLEEYLLGVVPLEIGPRPLAELEAVKAQAVAARTYAVRHLSGRESLGFDFYATVADQVYGGVSSEDPTATRAVRETAGEIVAYQGSPILAYYHSTCGGRTAAIEEAWPHRAPLPYLKSVSDEAGKDRYFCESSNRFRWNVTWSGQELRETLARTLASRAGRARRIGRIERVEIKGWTRSGRARSLEIRTDAGEFVIPGDSIRRVLEPEPGRMLNSTVIVLDEERRGGEVTSLGIRGGGWGHGVGMCQVGALGRARAGQDYRRILTTYYQGTEIVRVY